MTTNATPVTELPWLASALRQMRQAFDGARAPHALLINGRSGAGLEQAAHWLIAQLHCEQASGCGECRACRWLAEDVHPDHAWLRPVDKSQEIRIDQVRELIEAWSLSRHGRGRRTALLMPAERLNRHAANSLLKLLEEPPEGSVLILATATPSRLPATIRSRCLRIDLPAPGLAQAAAWLAARQGGDATAWQRVLRLSGNTPLRAVSWDLGSAGAALANLQREWHALAAGEREPLLLAREWDDDRYEQRLLELENLVTETLLRAAEPGTPHLPSQAGMPKLRAMFELLDRIRDDRRLADAPLNRRHGLTTLLAAAQAALREAGIHA